MSVNQDDEITVAFLEEHDYLRHVRLHRYQDGDVFIEEIPSRIHEHAYPMYKLLE